MKKIISVQEITKLDDLVVHSKIPWRTLDIQFKNIFNRTMLITVPEKSNTFGFIEKMNSFGVMVFNMTKIAVAIKKKKVLQQWCDRHGLKYQVSV